MHSFNKKVGKGSSSQDFKGDFCIILRISAIDVGRKCVNCKPSNLTTRVLKECIETLLPIITTIVNKSITESYVPATFRKAVVRPLLKKPGLKWAREKLHWRIEGQWDRVIFSDESQVVVGNNNRIYIWRKKDEAESRDCVCPHFLLYNSPVVSFWIQRTLNCSFRHLSLSIFIKSGCHVLQWGLTVAPN
jgi:hypothetical protein